MHGSAVRAAAESYMGQVELGVGLVPAAGGCKELAFRYYGSIPHGVKADSSPSWRSSSPPSDGQGLHQRRGSRQLGFLKPATRSR